MKPGPAQHGGRETLSLKNILFVLFSTMYVHVHVHVGAHRGQRQWDPLGAGIIGGCESSNMGAINRW